MNNSKQGAWLFPAGVVVAAIATFFLVRQYQLQQVNGAAAAASAQAPPAAAAGQAHHPIEDALQQLSASPTPAFNLPALADSDSQVDAALSDLFGAAFDQLFIKTDIVQHLVATIDNLGRDSVAQRLMPVRGAVGSLAVTGTNEALAIAPDNAQRYAPFVQLAQAVDTRRLVAVYVRFYPLFQEAYEKLGYPNGYFNDRLVQVIDSLLKAPEVQGPVRLIQPHVLYQFADPELEALPAGQKVLVRIGPDNEAAMKAKLREIRALLVAAPPGRKQP